MERTRQYYRALGYTKDYVWATFADVPFTPLPKRLSATRIALITTANPPDYDGVRRLWYGSTASPPPSLHTADLAWDKESTHTDDRECFLPIEVASELAAEGVVAGLTGRFYGVPTDYSQRKPSQVVAPRVLERLREDGADAAILCSL
ncbi:MAG TPA: hypothetical protein VFQ90_01395 [Stellaceae bacterium]|jgi:hypothetical protein|nr:hypothetical protein [Stellaceae bacterium]